MAHVERSPQAEADLESILDELDLRNRSVADRYATAFDEKHQLLARFPELGHTRPEIAPHVRSVLVHPYVLFYRLEGETVQILRILHGKMDLGSIMKSESQG